MNRKNELHAIIRDAKRDIRSVRMASRNAIDMAEQIIDEAQKELDALKEEPPIKAAEIRKQIEEIK